MRFTALPLFLLPALTLAYPLALTPSLTPLDRSLLARAYPPHPAYTDSDQLIVAPPRGSTEHHKQMERPSWGRTTGIPGDTEEVILSLPTNTEAVRSREKRAFSESQMESKGIAVVANVIGTTGVQVDQEYVPVDLQKSVRRSQRVKRWGEGMVILAAVL